jgi:ABC-2 type transport system ATP-binding protein
LGYLPEQPYYYEYLTPRETIDFYARLQGLDAPERAREWARLAELLELHDIADQRIKGFSKGMRQRVGFAVALVGDPPLLILDEPMSGLDPVGRRMIRQLILRCKEEKKTVFFSSHVLSDVEQICDRAGILVRGRLVREGRIADLLDTASTRIETVFSGLPEATVAHLRTQADACRPGYGLEVFTWADDAAANDAVRACLAVGGTLVEYTPLKESLEDYFMREQERAGEKGAMA